MTLAVFVLSWVIVDLIGYWLHRWAHRPSSPMYGSHMTHHVRNYPSGRFLSDSYIESGDDSLARLFAPYFLLYVLAALLLVPWPLSMVAIAGAVPPVVLSSVVHDMTHVRNSLLWRSRLLRRLAVHHYGHHRRMGRNFGVTHDLWDRLFHTRWLCGRSPQ